MLNRQHHGQTIHPTENYISMNLFKILCVVTWAWLFLTSEVLEAVRGQKHHISTHTLAFGSSLSASSAYQRFTKKFYMTLSLHSASISWILEPSPQGLISSELYFSQLFDYFLRTLTYFLKTEGLPDDSLTTTWQLPYNFLMT